MAYSREIREVAIKMMLPPNSKTLTQIYEQTNIPIPTLTKWREEIIEMMLRYPVQTYEKVEIDSKI